MLIITFAQRLSKKEVIMPNGNGTGPSGMGPMTGRGLGYCAGYENTGYNNLIGKKRGRGFFLRGRGPGFGRMGFGRYAKYESNNERPLPKEEEILILESRANDIRIELERIEKRISELESNTEK